MNTVILAGYITDMHKEQFSIQFTVKTSEKGYTTATNKRIPDRVDYHICYAKAQISDFIYKTFKVGDSVQIYGRLQNTLLDNGNGEKKKLTYIKVMNVNLYTFLNLNPKTVGKKVDKAINLSKINPVLDDFNL